MTYKDMGLAEVCKLPGVVDIKPVVARARFGQALVAESKGEGENANRLLAEAIDACAA